MTCQSRKTSESGLPAFTLTELLVALAVLSVGITGALAALLYARTAIAGGRLAASPAGIAHAYLAGIYASSSPRKALLSPEDETALAGASVFPVRLPVLSLDRTDGLTVIMARTVRRHRPFLIDLTVETLRNGKPLARLDTTVSESVLERLED